MSERMADLAICRRCKKRSLEHDPMRREWRCLWRDCDYVESEPAHAAAIKYEAREAKAALAAIEEVKA